MAGMLDEIMGTLGGQGGGLGSLLGGVLEGADDNQVESAVSGGLGAILGGLAKNASDEGGASALLGALNNKHDGGVLDNITGLLGGGDFTDGGKILGHVLGEKQDGVVAGIADSAGVDKGMIGKLLPMLAPIVMGFLGRQAKEKALDATGLAGLLGQEKETLTGSSGLSGILGMLDTDGDGDVMDNVGGIMGKIKDILGG